MCVRRKILANILKAAYQNEKDKFSSFISSVRCGIYLCTIKLEAALLETNCRPILTHLNPSSQILTSFGNCVEIQLSNKHLLEDLFMKFSAVCFISGANGQMSINMFSFLISEQGKKRRLILKMKMLEEKNDVRNVTCFGII